MSWLLCGALLLTLAQAQPAREEDSPHPPPTLHATLRSGAQESEIGVTITASGPLFALPALVNALGGRLHSGPLDESHRLEVGGAEALLGTTSSVLVIGETVEAISRPPTMSNEGLLVSMDVLEKTFGRRLGLDFRWDDDARVLEVGRLQAGALGVAIESVDIQGVSTVVLEFEREPRYSVQRRGQVVDVIVQGDRLNLLGRPQHDPGSLVSDIQMGSDRVRLLLVDGAAAADPYELRRGRSGRAGFRLVFDVSRSLAPRSPQAARGPGPRPRTIVIDPGHGGIEVGATGPAGTQEKDLTLQLARELQRKLSERLPVRVLLTRAEDADLPLETRTAIANQVGAELFLSLHLNSSFSPSASGAETFFLSLQATDEIAADLARSENRSAGAPAAREQPGEAEDPGLELLLWDLAQSYHLAASQQLARLIQEELNGALGLRDRGVRQAPFSVLMGATMPAVLLELGFLSNPGEEQQLLDPAYRSDLLDAVVRAVVRYDAQVAEGREKLLQNLR